MPTAQAPSPLAEYKSKPFPPSPLPTMCLGIPKQTRQDSQVQAYAHPAATTDTSTPAYASIGRSGRRGRLYEHDVALYGPEVAERKRRGRRGAAVVGAINS